MIPEILSIVISGGIALSLADDFQNEKSKRNGGTVKSIDIPTPQSPVSHIYTPKPASVPTGEIKPYGERLESLKSLLDSHGLIPVWELRNATPVRFTGWQRSGKTTKAQTLALLRQLDNPSHPVTATTPHKITTGDKPWPSSFRVLGEGNQWGEIKGELDRIKERLHKGDCNPYTEILDEFSGYVGNGGMDQEYIQGLMLSAIREAAKHQEMLILLAHGDTVALNGGVKGLTSAMWGNFVSVQCNRLLIDGKATPSPEVQISGGGFPDTAIIWPQWFNPQWLIKQFPELLEIKPIIPASTIPDLGSDIPELGEDDLDTSDELPDHIQAVLAYVQKKKEPVTIRQIQQAKLSVLVNFGNNRSETIELILDNLIYQGKLTLTGIGQYVGVGVLG